MREVSDAAGPFTKAPFGLFKSYLLNKLCTSLYAVDQHLNLGE